MSVFVGGVEPNAKVRVLTPERKTLIRRLASLRPGEKLGQAGSNWYFAVNEVRTSRRRKTGYILTLESGEKLKVAEGTIICGQFGPNLLTDQTDELLCLVLMNAFYDSTDSRRNFRVQFYGTSSDEKLIKQICKSRMRDEKKFFRFSEVIAFLGKLAARHPEIRIVPCLEIATHGKPSIYDFASCVKSPVFFPLVRLQIVAETWNQRGFEPTAVAFCEDGIRITSRKVVTCESIESDGPWVMPIFDVDLERHTFPQQRFSWTANGVPVFDAIIPYIEDWAAEVTVPKKGQEILPPKPPPTDYRFMTLGFSYDALCENFGSADSESSADQEMNQLWEVIEILAKKGVPGSALKEYLIEKIRTAFGAEAPSQ